MTKRFVKKGNVNIKEIVSIFLLFIIISGLTSGCYDKREVDDLAYVVAIGLDKGVTNTLRLTVQIAEPLVIGAGGSGGGGGNEKSSIVTVETPSLYAGLNLINNSVSKEINLSHAKLIVFSEELAKEGLRKYLHAIIRGIEFRPTTYVAVSRCPARDYLQSIKPILDPHPAKYYELEFPAGNTGFTTETQLSDFYFETEALGKQAVAVLASVDAFKDVKDFNLTGSTYKEKGREKPLEGDFKAGDIPKVGDVEGQIMGLAAFKGDKMVGEMDGEDVNLFRMLTGEYGGSYWSIPDPKVKDTIVVISVKKSRQPQIKVDMVNGKPKIDIKVIIEADFESIQSEEDYEENSTFFETYTQDFLKKEMLRFLKETITLKTDIVGFGKYMQRKFLTWDEWKNFQWLKKYKDSSFNVAIDLKMRRPGLIIKTVNLNSSLGEVK